MKLTIVHLYAAEMNIYGDRGNILTLVHRLKWRGHEAQVRTVGVGEEFDCGQADIIFAGGGQDQGQIAVGQDLQQRADALHQLAEDGLPMLVICGTYQLFGRRFLTLEGTDIPGIAIFRAETRGSAHRMIGNIVISSALGPLVGFENHSGETLLDLHQAPLGAVKRGFGNNYSSGSEGATYKNCYGTYLHGPILPKNPALADHLILAALRRRGFDAQLTPLNDDLEQQAARIAMTRPQ